MTGENELPETSIESPRARSKFVPRLSPDSSFKLIGLGGVGRRLSVDVAIYLASLGLDLRLVLVDGDDFEPSNASRLSIPRYGNKATVLSEELLPQLQGSRLTVTALDEYVTPENISRVIHEGDTVILAVDNHSTRKLVSDFCGGPLGFQGVMA